MKIKDVSCGCWYAYGREDFTPVKPTSLIKVENKRERQFVCTTAVQSGPQTFYTSARVLRSSWSDCVKRDVINKMRMIDWRIQSARRNQRLKSKFSLAGFYFNRDTMRDEETLILLEEALDAYNLQKRLQGC